jgi:hypothetical protein
VSLPPAEPGLVIRYSYLWRREALSGREEGSKDRPATIVLAIEDEAGETLVYVLPITHNPPRPPDVGVEIPGVVKERLRLDGERSWVVISEANAFIWPGPDLRPVQGAQSGAFAYGFLPPRLFRLIRDRYLALDAARRVNVVHRSD